MFRIPFAMHAGDDNDLLINNAVEERIGKPVQKSALGTAMEDWKPIWMIGDGAKYEGDLVQIFVP